MKTNLFKATIKEPISPDEFKERITYVASEDLMAAAKIMTNELSVSEQLRNIAQVSEECYVG